MHVSWAPDGGRFAFASTKGGSSQIWLAKFDSAAGTVTATSQLTTIATEAQMVLSGRPTAQILLFVSQVDAGCEDEDCNRRRLEEVGPLAGQGPGLHALALPPLEWLPAGQKKPSMFIDRRLPAEPLAISPPETTTFLPSAWVGRTSTPSRPTGARFATPPTTMPSKPRARTTTCSSMPVGGGEAKKITQNPASDSTPLYSRDGSYIAYRAQFRARIRERSLSFDAVQPPDRRKEESDRGLRSLGRDLSLGSEPLPFSFSPRRTRASR
jgi:dipeptidyl aminopeptidase/acylaminoacyl peptidase